MRGAFGVSFNLAFTFGQVLINAFSINGVIRWGVISGLSIAIPGKSKEKYVLLPYVKKATLCLAAVALAVSMFFNPESPRHLIAKGRESKAAEALQRVRGKHYDIAEEFKTMVRDEAMQKSVGTIPPLELLTERMYSRPFLIMMMLIFLQQCSGVTFFFSYTQEIFVATGSNLDPGDLTT